MEKVPSASFKLMLSLVKSTIAPRSAHPVYNLFNFILFIKMMNSSQLLPYLFSLEQV